MNEGMLAAVIITITPMVSPPIVMPVTNFSEFTLAMFPPTTIIALATIILDFERNIWSLLKDF
jgi:hypothetical protein